jgi:hypothetical protein
MLKFKILVLTVICAFCSTAQTIFNISTNSDSGLGSIRDAINQANLLAPNASFVIDMTALMTSPYYIILTQDLPTITLNSNNKLTIIANSNFLGFKVDPMLNNIVAINANSIPNSTHFSLVTRGLKINTNRQNNNIVILDGLSFVNFNTAVSMMADYGTNKYVRFTPTIEAWNSYSITIKNCFFGGYYRAILYNNDVQNMTISNNLIETAQSQPLYWDPINNGAVQPNVEIIPSSYNVGHNHVDYHSIGIELSGNNYLLPPTGNTGGNTSIISHNTIYVSNSLDKYGSGIYINPVDVNSGIITLANINDPYNVRADVTIDKNYIWGYSVGIDQGMAPHNRGIYGPDLTYKLNITNNKLDNRERNVVYRAPYNSFALTNNTLIANSNNTTYYKIDNGCDPIIPHQKGHPFSLVFISCETYDWPNSYNVTNQFGFTIDKFSNKNANNIFINSASCINDSVRPFIFIEGNYGPDDFSQSPGTGILIQGIKYPGPIMIVSGRRTSISQCTLEGTYRIGCLPYNNPPGFYSMNGQVLQVPKYTFPISHTFKSPYEFFTNSFTPPANNGISSPIIQEAYITVSNNIQVTFDLVGAAFNDNSGQFKVEFYDCNSKGDFKSYLGSFTTPLNLTNNTYTVTLLANSLPSNYILAPGNRLALTVTSLGNRPNSTHYKVGTSEPSYIDLGYCTSCIGEFSPIPGKKYIVSCWTKLNGPNNATTYNNWPSFPTPVIEVIFYKSMNAGTSAPSQLGQTIVFKPSGTIIDGWQKIEGSLTIPINAKGLNIRANHLVPSGCCDPLAWGSYFDDIRFFPNDAMMKSYVYDEITKKHIAILDENNYGTFYEYDVEGKLARIKKETEKGIITVKEVRDNKPIR